jgi:hypothetical protein
LGVRVLEWEFCNKRLEGYYAHDRLDGPDLVAFPGERPAVVRATRQQTIRLTTVCCRGGQVLSKQAPLVYAKRLDPQ